MRRTEALQGVRMAMFLNGLNRWELAELNQAEAAEVRQGDFGEPGRSGLPDFYGGGKAWANFGLKNYDQAIDWARRGDRNQSEPRPTRVLRSSISTSTW